MKRHYLELRLMLQMLGRVIMLSVSYCYSYAEYPGTTYKAKPNEPSLKGKSQYILPHCIS